MQGIFSMNNASEDFGKFYAQRFRPVRDLNHMLENYLQIKINLTTEMLDASIGNWKDIENRRADTKEQVKEYTSKWKEFNNKGLDANEKRMSDELMKIVLSTKKYRAKMEKAINSRNVKAAYSNLYYLEKGYEAGIIKLKAMIDYQEKQARKMRLQQEATAREVFMVSIVLLLSAVALGILVTVVLSRAVTLPVKKGVLFAEKIASGDLTERIDLDQKDELGQLANALNNAADRLDDLVSNVTFAAGNLAQAVEQIASGNENLSQRTSEQASSLEEIASTVEEANATSRENAKNAAEAKSVSDNSFKLAQEGGVVSGEAVAGINEISAVSRKIGEITNVINEISFQTNLLALNAAVEAARAGDAGKGFAVVAGEIRSLAQRSGNAAREIEELIEDTVARIETGTDLVVKSGDSLNQIIEANREVGKIVSEIAAASDEQRLGIEQISTAVSSIDSMTQQNAALVEESASASEEMANQAQELISMTKQFKVKSDNGIG